MAGTDWRSETLERIRTLIEQADPDVYEEAKWVKPSNPAGVPTWSHDGILCTGEVYKDKVKLTFMNGVSWPTRAACSTPVSMPGLGGRSTSPRATSSTTRRSRS